MNLSAGVYELRMINVGSGVATVQWLLTIESLDWEKIIDNGVSQASALSLMTFSPTLAGPDTGTISGLLSIAPSASRRSLGRDARAHAGQLVRQPQHVPDWTAGVGRTRPSVRAGTQ